MGKEHNTIFELAERLRELQAERDDAERVLKEIDGEIYEAECLLSGIMEKSREAFSGWLAVLVGVFEKVSEGKKETD